MDFSCCYSSSQINSQKNTSNEYNNKFFENRSGMFQTNSHKVYCGCLLYDPQELGPKIERPLTPFAYPANANHHYNHSSPVI